MESTQNLNNLGGDQEDDVDIIDTDPNQSEQFEVLQEEQQSQQYFEPDEDEDKLQGQMDCILPRDTSVSDTNLSRLQPNFGTEESRVESISMLSGIGGLNLGGNYDFKGN